MDVGALIYYKSLLAICLFASLMNLLILITFMINRLKLWHNPCNKILMALSIAELLFGITGTINWVLVTTAHVDIYKTVGMIPMFASALASVNVLCILTFNQLVAIERPLRHASLVTDKRVNAAVALAFSLSLAFFLIQVIIYLVYGGETELNSRSIFVTVYFAVGLLVLTTSNYRLYVAIQKQRRKLRPLPCLRQRERIEVTTSFHDLQVGNTSLEENVQKRVNAKQNFKNGRICIFLVIVYVINWLPLTAYRISSLLGRSLPIKWALRSSMTLAAIHQICTPLLYILNRNDIRTMVKRVVCRLRRAP